MFKFSIFRWLTCPRRGTELLRDVRVKPVKCAVVYHTLPHYRWAVFSRLCRQESPIEFTLFSDPVDERYGIKNVPKELARATPLQGGLRWRFVKNIWIFKQLLWQTNVVALSATNEFQIVIFLGNPYFVSTWLSAMVAKIRGKTVLFWTHGFLKREGGLKGLVRATFYSLADGTMVYGARAKQLYEQRGFCGSRIEVIYNSLDYEQQRGIRMSLKPEELMQTKTSLFPGRDFPTIVFIGRLTKAKQLDKLVDAVKLLDSRGFPCNVLLIGSGGEEASLKSRIEELHLGGSFVFYGEVYDEATIGRLVSMADVCVSPGEVGLTAMHALAFGTPVITHDNADEQMPEYEAISHGINGMLYRQGDVGDLAACIENWLVSNKDRAKVALSCIEVIEKFYNPDFQCTKITNFSMEVFRDKLGEEIGAQC